MELCLPEFSPLSGSSQGESGDIFACGLESGKKKHSFCFLCLEWRTGVFAAHGLLLLISWCACATSAAPPLDSPSVSLNPGPLAVRLALW